MSLKTPSRMAALGLVFVLALMVRNHIQYTVRGALAENNETLPNLNKQPTKTPTAENVLEYFEHMAVVIEKVDGLVTRHVHGFTKPALRVLEILGMESQIFHRPRKSVWASAGSSR